MMCLEESLGRLQTDYVDVYLLHVPDAKYWQDECGVFETLKEMKRSGQCTVCRSCHVGSRRHHARAGT